MYFEVGKQYVFNKNEFEISRETGKLYFIVHDPASDNSYKIKPFEFQYNNLPDKLDCVYIGDYKFEQRMAAILPQIYNIGESYKFRVLRQDYTSGLLSLRDDHNGITHFDIDLGKQKFVRFDRINCKVSEIFNDKLKLTYEFNNVDRAQFFSFDDFKSLPETSKLEQHGLISRLLEEAPLGETRKLLENRDISWVPTLFEALDRNIIQLVGKKLKTRSVWLDRIRSIIIELIENSGFLNMLPHGERYAMQERLSAIISNCEDNIKATQLIMEGRDEKVIKDALSSLAGSGWLYNPEKKMRVIMAIFNFRPSIDDSYIDEIFRIIKDNHDNERFNELFMNGFIEMLHIYISNESKNINQYNRQALRKLAEALAIELLLTENRDFVEWNNHRGLLYIIGMLLMRNIEDIIVQKAVMAFTLQLDYPLEYGWRDMDDITRLCHARLTTPIPTFLMKSVNPKTVFEGENTQLSFINGTIIIAPPQIGPSTREAFSFNLTENLKCCIYTNERLDEKHPENNTDLRNNHRFWNNLDSTLFAKDKFCHTAEMIPEPGIEVPIVIMRQDDYEEHLFHCRIVDSTYTGIGTITTRDIVQYPVKTGFDTFCHEGRQLLLKATVTAVDPDGTCHFSMRQQSLHESINMATYDIDEGDCIKAVITGENDNIYLGIVAGGYPISIPKKEIVELAKNDAIYVAINRMTFDLDKKIIYVSAAFDSFDDENNHEQNYHFVKDQFHELLLAMSKMETVSDEDVNDILAQAETPDDAPEYEITAREVSWISRLLDGMAIVKHNNLIESYTLLAIARILAQVASDPYRTEYIAAKMSLVETLSSFAINGKLDKTHTDLLTERCMRIAPSDSDMLHKLAVIRAISTIDRPIDECLALTMHSSVNDEKLEKLRRMVAAYNLLRGLDMQQMRNEIMTRIVEHLNLPMPKIDTTVVNEKEDQYNEFKESIIYPAGNNMQADERRQIKELMEVTCGFLNSDGGTIYLGVNNLGIPKGLDSDFRFLNHGHSDYDLHDIRDKFNLVFCKGLRDHFGVTVQGVALYPDNIKIEHYDINGKYICNIEIKPFHGMVRMTDNQVFVRQDSSTVPIINEEEQAAFEKQRITRRYSASR